MESVLRVEGINKSFAGNKVLNDVSFSVQAGHVHSLVGENGAGKSTLMNIVGGIHRPDSGQIFLEGRPVSFSDPWQAKQHGISIVHQELSLAPNMKVAQNIFIRREPINPLGFINWKRMYTDADALFQRIGVDISPTALVGDYSVAMQQIIEIAKAISFNAKVIIMDEPTSALSETEVERLYSIVRDLKAQGVAIVFISHKLSEVFKISDEISVLRDGNMVGEVRAAESSTQDVIQMMVGRSIKDLYPDKGMSFGEEILTVEGFSRPPYYQDVSFGLRRGEILGFAGLVGSGRTEVARAIFGADSKTAGKLRLFGKEITIKSPQDAIAHGIAYLSEDRKSLGLFLKMTVRDNIIAASLDRMITGAGMLKHKAIAQESRAFVEKMEIRPFNDEVSIISLSGGNQQKSLLAKWLSSQPKVLIADEPTRGVDVGAKAKIHSDLRALAHQGVGVIVISSELPEVLGLSDRIAVFREGRLTTILDGAHTSQEEVMKYATK
ncbi:MAG: sugar ABC transporter ATP-binding protein [Anaerolineae bacterium]|nr:sugar ABC transporter ATP-binding protein [Anaerolineae bacterium]